MRRAAATKAARRFLPGRSHGAGRQTHPCDHRDGETGAVLFAHWSSRVLLSLLGHSSSLALPPVFLDLTMDLRVLTFTIGMAVGTGLLFGLAPAWRGTRVNPESAIKANSRGISKDILDSEWAKY
jgi:hypothetical protein